tara:strand:+ start:365 stop:556 length:192 start_codon:yes stop_codon:yes gene_type:complete
MKAHVTFKTPDAVFYALTEDAGLEEGTEEYLAAEEAIQEFVAGGEYVTIEFDTENRTATVLER